MSSGTAEQISNGTRSPWRQVFLATSRSHPNGENGHEACVAALAKRRIEGKWVIWDDPQVEWARADLVATRSTWDYQDHLPEFLAWAESLGCKLLHGAQAFRWNADKKYLLELEAHGVSIVPTKYATTIEAVRAAVSQQGPCIVKPAVGGSGIGVEIVKHLHANWVPSSPGPWIVQPFIESVLSEGETTIFLVEGLPTLQMAKTVSNGEFKVQEEYGGHAERVLCSPEAQDIAHLAYTTTEAILGSKLSYARVDMLRYKGRLVISEVEIIEPQFYFDLVPEHADKFADMLDHLLSRSRCTDGVYNAD